MADPWPEPDDALSAVDSGEEAPSEMGADGDKSNDTENGFKVDTDTSAGGDTAADAGDVILPDDDGDSEKLGSLDTQIYCSAPGPDGMVTVVALAGTILADADVTIVGEKSQHLLSLGEDGGFVDRFPAGPNESLSIVVREKVTNRETRVTVMTGTRAGDYVSDAILGDGTIAVVEAVNQAIVHGQGGRLDEQYLVVGGNLQRATGRVTPVSCDGTPCSFDLLIPANAGDSIDLFLVPLAEHTGRTDVQTVPVP